MALIDGLISYWKFDDTNDTDALDAHGSNHGTQEGAGLTDGVAGKINTAFDFDGDDTSVDITGLTSTSKDYTFNIWVKSSTDDSSSDYLFDSQTGRLVIAWSSLDIAYNMGVYDGVDWRDFGVSPPADGAWHLISVVLDSGAGKATLYIDAVKQATEPTYSGVDLGGDIRLAAAFSGIGAEYIGVMDEVAIFEETKNQAEITSFYNSGDGLAYPFGAPLVTNPKIKVSGTFSTKTIKTKISNTFTEKPLMVKVGGAFQ